MLVYNLAQVPHEHILTKASEEVDLIFNPKDFPELKEDDIVEICTVEDKRRFVLQVKSGSLSSEFNNKDALSVSSSVATLFKLQAYMDICISVVNVKDVTLDLIELIYKEQYVSRADMWKLREKLGNSCVYLNKKMIFSDICNTAEAPQSSLLRSQVNELWMKGELVTCGVVTADTRVVLRSATAQVNIFIQMSVEMWQSDNYGDLYFEKAVGGFLENLFTKWKEKDCNHDVTITMFSRTFYDAKSIDEFPLAMRECVQVDCLGRFFEDFYRVVVQNERYDDWQETVIKLKRLFLSYRQCVLHYHEQPGLKIPTASNSSAAEGNVLEVLNMSLNVFEKFYLDRCFDRTGKLSIVITPGQGVFHVDRDLTNITKQRTIDCGNSSDLVCMGEQPLHAAPLFKFYKKSPSLSKEEGHDYNIPHWINHSFYTSPIQQERIDNHQFVPRILIPDTLFANKSIANSEREALSSDVKSSARLNSSVFTNGLDSNRYPFVNYDEHDQQVFKHNSHNNVCSKRTRDIQTSHTNTGMKQRTSSAVKVQSFDGIKRSTRSRSSWTRRSSEVTALRLSAAYTNSSGSSLGKHSTNVNSQEMLDPYEEFVANSFTGHSNFNSTSDLPSLQPLARSLEDHIGYSWGRGGYSDSSILQGEYTPRALINPFAPTQLHFKVTSNRRRWAHAFPTDHQGASVQLHHQQESTEDSSSSHSAQTPIVVNRRRFQTQRVSEGSDDVYRGDRTRSYASGHDLEYSMDSLRDPLAPYQMSNANTSLALPNASLTAAGISSAGLTTPVLRHVASSSDVSLTTVESSSSINSVVNLYEHERQPSTGARGVSSMSGLGHSPTHLARDFAPFTVEEGHAWLWGVTGEQEWTPNVTTGMDWKSMTIPASLPLTTDYLPEEMSLKMDYLMSNYTLLPTSYTERKRLSDRDRAPATIEMIYSQLVAQRIAQGFQQVLLARPTMMVPQWDSNISTALNVAPSSSPYTSGFFKGHQEPMKREEHVLSIGRLFHRLTLEDDVIKVSRYWPRHPYPLKSHHYTYRFQVPDSHTYDVSWSNFSNEKLEICNWNRLDLNICSRGRDEDFILNESEKFWRATFVLLPSGNAATKKILEGEKFCDIYEERATTEQDQLLEGFIRFLEIINKLKKPNKRTTGPTKVPHSRKTSLTHSPVPPSSNQTPTTPGIGGNTQGGAGGDSRLEKPKSAKNLNLSLDGQPSETEQIDTGLMSSLNQVSMLELKKAELSNLDDPVSLSATPINDDSTVLSIRSPLTDICEAMLDPNKGVLFVQKTASASCLSAHTFIATDGVSWLIDSVAGVTSKQQALTLLQIMLREGYIVHGSLQPRQPFVYGFYFYTIDKSKLHTELSDSTSYVPYQINTQHHHEWMEVNVYDSHNRCSTDTGQSDFQGHNRAPFFLCTKLPEFYPDFVPQLDSLSQSSYATSPASESSFKQASVTDTRLTLPTRTGAEHTKIVNVELDYTPERMEEEWASACYHGHYHPNTAFSLELQWLVATGYILAALVAHWGRKAATCGFHFLPVPKDPFALPFSPNSDPLRGPIFVPLNVNCLMTKGKELFEEFLSDTREERMVRFQDLILRRFGFMLEHCDPKFPGSFHFSAESRPQYVHCTGGMFVLVPDNYATSPRNDDGTHCKPQSSSYFDYIAWQRQLATKTSGEESNHRIGFLWAWNYMLTKRWRSSYTGDESFQDKMLRDFRAFCSNSDGRLVGLWNDCWASRQEKMNREETE